LGVLFPGAGYTDIYSTSQTGVEGYTPLSPQDVPDVLYSGFLSATITF
jgi:hypothetical protein